MELIKDWYRRYFSDPQIMTLALLLISGFVFILLSSEILAPLYIAIILAYLLEGLVRKIQHPGMPRLAAVIAVFTIFMLFLIITLFLLIPNLSRQTTLFLQELPKMITRGESMLIALPEYFPDMFSEAQVTEWLDRIKQEIMLAGQHLLTRTVSSLVSLITFIIYVILVPFLVFFMMKDKERIVDWVSHHLPRNRALASAIWIDVDRQIGNYIRGKFFEILIIWFVCYITFSLFGLNYATLLSFLVGLSVIIPYVGAVIVTIPIAIIAYFQWGIGSEWSYLMLTYLIIQALDANVLVPLLFSEVVGLHPVAIIIAVLFFGGIWGVGGVFFAIPLATLVQAILKAWPTRQKVAQIAENARN
ncbi:AI-2E family transporter [Nitrosomonas mobilis]|uniref:Putative permease PerM n=1 Tax=Nitrosomonas mobilis TaxID=51642 RepID=A0A1G5SCW8_9PROT|nr:AI-2E family transporter [Nitrosomonas mobilis]SCZ84837.1 putative permease PerM [Nitrosomonas mobilis]